MVATYFCTLLHNDDTIFYFRSLRLNVATVAGVATDHGQVCPNQGPWNQVAWEFLAERQGEDQTWSRDDSITVECAADGQ